MFWICYLLGGAAAVLIVHWLGQAAESPPGRWPMDRPP